MRRVGVIPPSLLIVLTSLACTTPQDSVCNHTTIRQHSDEFFQKLRQEEERKQPERLAQVRSDQTAPTLPLAQPQGSHLKLQKGNLQTVGWCLKVVDTLRGGYSGC